MLTIDIFEISLPLTNPVIKFLLILVIILLIPIILNKIRIPPLLGLIIAGAIIGPNGFFLMERDSGIILSGTAGLLYIMFLAGLEIDLADFKKNSGKSVVFGMYTFLIPMTLGTLAGLYVLEYSILSSVLLASMFASHTLIAYPIISKMGVTRNKAVNIAVGGTMITDTLALLVLAVIVGMTAGEVNTAFWVRLSLSLLIFGLIVTFFFPILARWFLKKYDDNVSQYIFVLSLVFLGAVLAELAGIEAIIGAFLTGLALNSLIPHTSPLMNRIEFVGNAIFIPFFLIGVGMLIDYRAFISDLETLKVGGVMIITATSAKFAAAWLTQKTFRFSVDERRLIFGLSNAQAAATLAAVLVGYNIILGETETGEPLRLLDESILNGTILMILFTCTIASFAAQKGARNIALVTGGGEENSQINEKILIPVSNSETTDELIALGVTLKSQKTHEGLYALSIVDTTDPNNPGEQYSKKVLEKAAITASATDILLHKLLRYDVNIINGITGALREHKITDLILGLHVKKGISDSFLGNLTEGILSRCNTTTFIYKAVQPLVTVKRHLVFVPEKAEKEIGFPFWLLKLWNLARNSGTKLIFYATPESLGFIKEVHKKHPVTCEFNEFRDWDDLLILSREIKKDDSLIIIMSRRDKTSYSNSMKKIPDWLNRYFAGHSFILIYPLQAVISGRSNYNIMNPTFPDPEKWNEMGKTISKLFSKK